MRIDSHQHFWRPARGDYGWLDAAPARLQQDFLPADLAPLIHACGIDATILVQAAPTLAETHFLLDLAGGHPMVAGVVGWLDVAAPEAPRALATLAARPGLVGIRPMLQEIADTDFVLRPEVTPFLEALIGADLCFDALIQPRHLEVIDLLMRRHPALRLVIDHGAKPNIAAGAFSAWAEGIAALAAHPGVHCKLSGLLTEAGPNARLADLAPYVETLLTCFGPDRLMWGSDWPVLLLADEYTHWHDGALSMIQAPAREAVFGATAARFYKLR